MNQRSRRHLTNQDEAGLGGIEGLVFGVLIFVFGTLVVVTAWGAIDARLAVDAAAREAARAFVESSSGTEANNKAELAARETLRGHKRPLTRIAFSPSSFSRCTPVAIEVETEVPRTPLPLIGRTAGNFQVTATHTEVVDPYRSGLAGSAVC